MYQEHGGNIYVHRGVLDFSANINPLGAPPAVLEAAKNAVSGCAAYPDPFCTRLTAALSAHEGLPPERIVCGNGAADLIYRIVHALRPACAGLLSPTFSEYAAALGEVGCEISRTPLSPETGFDLTDETAAQLTAGSPDIIFLCSPNNPTGRVVGSRQLESIVRACADNNTVFVCDECFLGFVRGGEGLSAKRLLTGNMIILKAFTKLYAIPGLRLGYALFGSEALAERVRRSGQFWSVSTPAQAAGEAALSIVGFAEQTAEYTAAGRKYLTDTLSEAGFTVFPSDANFLLFRAHEGLAEQLLERGILIRSCESFPGLDSRYFRIAVRTREENQRFAAALKTLRTSQ